MLCIIAGSCDLKISTLFENIDMKECMDFLLVSLNQGEYHEF